MGTEYKNWDTFFFKYFNSRSWYWPVKFIGCDVEVIYLIRICTYYFMRLNLKVCLGMVLVFWSLFKTSVIFDWSCWCKQISFFIILILKYIFRFLASFSWAIFICIRMFMNGTKFLAKLLMCLIIFIVHLHHSTDHNNDVTEELDLGSSERVACSYWISMHMHSPSSSVIISKFIALLHWQVIEWFQIVWLLHCYNLCCLVAQVFLTLKTQYKIIFSTFHSPCHMHSIEAKLMYCKNDSFLCSVTLLLM